ncbi:MAG: DUF4340 domain-containing protein [Candidatus Wallbacteria bacterium]|nr:DUF4340 domain-containing protein [Candidatus Wallbacteria bacterium]
MMKFLPTLLVLAVLGGLGFYVAKYEQEPMSEKSVPKVATTEKDKITRVDLEDTAKNTKVTLEKGKDGKWEVTAPLAAKTEEEKVDSLLTRLEKIKADRLVDGETPGQKPDLAKYALDKPGYKVTWNGGPAPRTVLIGKDSPLGTNAYVKMADEDKIFLVNSGDLEILKKDLYTFRDKTVLKADKEQVKEIAVSKASGEKWRFTHGADGNWTIEEPFKAPGDSQAIGDLANDLGRLRAEEFTAETTANLKPYGLDNPEMTAKLVMREDGATKVVLFGKRKETDSSRLYAKRETDPNVYLIDATLVKALGNKPDEFRDKSVLRTGDRDIASVTVEKGGEKVTAVKDTSGRWSYQASRVTSDPGSAGTRLLDKLKELKAARFVTGADFKPADFGLEKPEYRVELSLAARPATTTTTGAKAEPETAKLAILVGKTVEGGRYVRPEGQDVAMVTKEEFAPELDGFLKSYSEILPFDDWNLKAVELKKQERSEGYEINDKGDWHHKSQKEATSPLKERIKNFTTVLPHLVAKQWMEETPAKLEETGLAKPAIEVTVKTKDSRPDVKFRLGRASGKDYIKLDGAKGIGEISAEPLTRAEELLGTPVPAAASATPATSAPAASGTAPAAPEKSDPPKDSGAKPAEKPEAAETPATPPALPGLTKDPAAPANGGAKPAGK